MSYYDPIADAEETADITKNVQRMVAEQQGTPTPRTDASEIAQHWAHSFGKQSQVPVAVLARGYCQLERELSRSREDYEKLWDAAAFLRDLKTMKEALETQRGPVLTLAGGQLNRSVIQKYYDDNKERAWGNLRTALSTTRKEEGNG